MEAIDILIGTRDEEDERTIRRALRALLNRVTVLSEPRSVREFLKRGGRWARDSRAPELVVLDADLMEGDECWELVAELAGRDEYRETSFAMLVDEADKRDVDLGYEAGAEWVMNKPLTMDAMAKLVEGMEDKAMAVVRVSRT